MLGTCRSTGISERLGAAGRGELAHSRYDNVRDGKALLEGELGRLDNVVRVERRASGSLGGSLALGELLDAVEVDREDTGTVVGEQGGKGTTDNLGAV